MTELERTKVSPTMDTTHRRRCQQHLALIRASTTQLRAQTTALQAQVRKAENTSLYHTSDRRSLQQRRLATEHVRIGNEALLDEATSVLNTYRQHIGKEARSIPLLITQLLKADDRQLAITQGLMDEVHHDFGLSEMFARVEQLVHILKASETCRLKDKLDVTYLTALSKALTHGGPSDEVFNIKESVKIEIETLYEEIPDLVSMLVDKQHTEQLQQLLDRTGNLEAERKAQASRKVNHVSYQLDY
jgi:hypothetical protein